jgi:predicted Zn finger-like uncharacterized protein
MSFTTRCPACGTMFKVVPDQLKISDGWVRCGHCSDVFDAMLNLQGEISPSPAVQPASSAGVSSAPNESPSGSSRVVIRRTPIPAPTAPTPPPPVTFASLPSFQLAPQAPVPPVVAPVYQAPVVPAFGMALTPNDAPPPVQAFGNEPGWVFVDHPGEDDEGDQALGESGESLMDGVSDAWDGDWLLSPNSVSRHREAVAKELQSQQTAVIKAPEVAKSVDPSFERELDAFAELSKVGREPSPSERGDSKLKGESADNKGLEDSVGPSSKTGEDGGLDALPAEPTFVVQGRREAFWRSPLMRAWLLLVAVALSAALFVQWASFERDQLAARYPAMEPLLKQLCAATGCSLTAPRRIEAVAIDSSTLTRKLGQFYSFDLVVKNSEAMAVAMPALELSLTDSRDKEIARRVFLPEEMPGTPTVVPAKGSLLVSLRLSLAESDLGTMAGYRALVFYP